MNNQIVICGYVGQAPRLVNFPDTGNKVAKFSVAVKETFGGEEKTLWLDVDAWNALADRVMQIVSKGREVVITGRLAVNLIKATAENPVEREKPVIKLSSFHLCGAKPKTDETPLVSEATASAPRGKKPSRVRTSKLTA